MRGTSPYELYQYFLNTEDQDVGRFLRYYTSLDAPTIAELEETTTRAPQRREAQRVLARELTKIVHGREEASLAENAAAALFNKRAGGLVVPPGAPASEVPLSGLAEGIALVDLLTQTQLCSSKGAARREIEGGGIYLNDERVSDVARIVTTADRKEGIVLLRKGKKNYHVVRFV